MPVLRKTSIALAMAPCCVAAVAGGPARPQVQLDLARTTSPHAAYLDMGSPRALSAQQLRQLQESEMDRAVRVGADGRVQRTLPMRGNDAVLLTLEPAAN